MRAGRGPVGSRTAPDDDLRATTDRVGVLDLVAEAVHAIGSRPGRLLAAVLGIAVGIAALVATTGLAQTAGGQAVARGGAGTTGQMVITPAADDDGASVGEGIPWDVEDRLARLSGVRAVGAIGTVHLGDPTVTAVPVVDPSAPVAAPPPVLAATPGLLGAVGGTIATGRWFDAGHDTRADRVVVLGSAAASLLGVAGVDRQPSILLGGRPYAVIGILADGGRRSDLVDAVLLPAGTARRDFALARLEEARVTVAAGSAGAADVVAGQAPVALDPAAPGGFVVEVEPPPPAAPRGVDGVDGGPDAVLIAPGGAALLVGALGLVRLARLSVRERLGEIGVRRAFGARPRDVARQLLTESAVIGLLGGLLGAGLGVMTVVVVSLARGWTPVVDELAVLGSALLGAAVGLLAGAPAAAHAARIEPTEALRGSVT